MPVTKCTSYKTNACQLLKEYSRLSWLSKPLIMKISELLGTLFTHEHKSFGKAWIRSDPFNKMQFSFCLRSISWYAENPCKKQMGSLKTNPFTISIIWYTLLHIYVSYVIHQKGSWIREIYFPDLGLSWTKAAFNVVNCQISSRWNTANIFNFPLCQPKWPLQVIVRIFRSM